MKSTLVFASLCLFVLNANHAQNVLKGWIKDQITSKSIPFASISYKNQPIGVYGNEDGYFELNLKKDLPDSLVVGCLSYEKKVLTVQNIQQNSTIYLTPVDNKLAEIKITPKKKSKIVTKALGAHTAKPNNVYTSGHTSEGYTLLCFINNPNLSNAQIREAVYVIEPKYQMDSAVVKIHLFGKDKYSSDPKPSEELIKENLYVTIPPKTKKFKVNLEKYALIMPDEGIFIGLEWVKGHVSKRFSFQGTVFAPVYRGTYEEQPYHFIYRNFMNQGWERMPLKSFEGSVSTPMFGLNVLVEKE